MKALLTLSWMWLVVVVVIPVEVNQQFITDYSTASPSCVLEAGFVSHRFADQQSC